MNNPYPCPAVGSYRGPMVAGLTKLELVKEAEAFQSGAIRLAIVSGITGNVRTCPDLQDVCITALRNVPETPVTLYYIFQLMGGHAVPALTAGAYVYDNQRADQVEYVKKRLAESEGCVWAPGELFFKS